MRKFVFLFCAIFSLGLNATEVDIIASFDIDEFSLPIVKNAFTINKVKPKNYPASAAYDQNLKKILVFNYLQTFMGLHMPAIPKEKAVLFVWEPDFFPYSVYANFSRVYTWDDSLVDNVKFFRFNYPYLRPFRNSILTFADKKLCTMVVGRWTSERLKILSYFEKNHPETLECYGRFPPGLKNTSIYKGSIPGFHTGNEKISVLQNYRFCICFENTVRTKGYITEKIFGCFAAGCVPIYWGADNIETYIPKTCFIDYRDFASDAELFQYIAAMPAEEHQKYVENIKEFLQSDQAHIFSPEFFDQLLYEVIVQ